MTAQSTNLAAAELAQLVAEVQARGKGARLPAPSPAALAAVTAHLRDEVPMSAEEAAEQERQWAAVVAELRAVDQTDERRDGLR